MKNKILTALITISGYTFAQAQTGVDTAFTTYEQHIAGSPVSFKMVPIPAGTFVMGSTDADKNHPADESPAHKVQLSAFWMEEHEVTYEEFILFQDESTDTDPKPDGITRPSPPYIDFTLGMGKTGGFPANSMSQYSALMYCKWLYKKTGIFYRLPTEAEWEYACRAGTTTKYFFGNDEKSLSAYGWYAGNSDNKYHAVKQLKPNPWGLYDMLGNVAEWTLDLYGPYHYEVGGLNPYSTYQEPIPVKKIPRTLRGGHFRSVSADLRSAARLKSDPVWNARDPQIPRSKWWNTDAPFIGFRVVRSLNQPSAEEIDKFFERHLEPK